MSLSAGTRLGPYEILAPIGAGGMGEVYKAADTRLKRIVAIKILAGDAGADSAASRRLLREARTAAGLDHPNICTIHEVGEQDGRAFIVMQYVEGETLWERMRRTRLTVKEAVNLARQIADALAEAHVRGVIHRDIKPQNVMITGGGQVKVLDFGLARPPLAIENHSSRETAETATALTHSGTFAGTLQYMSPEQVRGQPLDARTDIFSFGAVLYEMLAGTPPFHADTDADILSGILSADAPPLTRRARDAPPELERITRKCLQKDLARRYQSLRDVVTDLEALSEDHRAARPPMTRHTRRLRIALLLTLLIIGIGAYALLSRVSSGASEVRSLAVLPLKALGTQGTDNYFGLGIADSVIARMGQTGSLTVRPTSAIRRYEKEDAESLAAGRQLKVDAVLEGTWQRTADRFRIRVHLLRVDSGATLWAETFDVAAADVFAIEDRVSRELADRLRLRLDPAERARLTKRQTSSPAAYEYYTKGVYAFGDRFDSANVLKSIDLFQQAIAADPRFALAHAQLGYAYAWRSIFVDATPAWLANAKQALDTAERLEPRLPQVHLARSFIAWSQFEGWQVEQAIRELQRARQIDPNVGHIELAELYWHIGLEEQAFREHELAIEQDPASDAPKVSLINEFYLSARPDEGLAAEQRFGKRPGARYYIEKRLRKQAGPLVETEVAQQPANPGRRSQLALLFCLRGQHTEAQAQVPSIVERLANNRSRHHWTYNIARIYACGGNASEAVKWLRETTDNGFPQYPLLQRDPYLDPIRQHPAFTRLLDELKLRWERYQREFG